MPFSGRDVRRNLKKKGFIEDKKHHIYLNHTYEGKRTGAYTFVSHGKEKEDVGPDIVRSMKMQLRLETNRQVHDLVNCPMTKKQYEVLLKRAGVIPSD